MKNQLSVDPASHLISDARFIKSPNCDARPDGEKGIISMVVIHGISLPPGQFKGQGVEQLFTNQLDVDEDFYYQKIKDLRVSAHLFIRRDGELIQFVPFHLKAWHAGLSEWKGREKCNDFSIGIELEGTDDQPYTHSQYVVLEQVLKALMQAYPTIGKTNIVGHHQIAPGRKTDPGQFFQWGAVDRFVENIKQED